MQDERRIIERVIEKLKASKDTIVSTIQELELENEMAALDLAKVSQIKEKKLVQHDINKLSNK